MLQQTISSQQELSAGVQVAIRSFMLNSAVNPYIIGMLSSKFRAYHGGHGQMFPEETRALFASLLLTTAAPTLSWAIVDVPEKMNNICTALKHVVPQLSFNPALCICVFIFTPGHTVGHTRYETMTQGKRLVSCMAVKMKQPFFCGQKEELIS